MAPSAILEGMRILLIEDAELLRESLVSGLRGLGYTVDATGDGVEGGILALARAYDLILLDLMLPGRDGLDILAALRAAGRSVPVLVLTARDAIESRIAGLDLGADDYLTKPFALTELLARVRALIRRSRQIPTAQIRCGDLRIDTAARCVHRGDAEVVLTAREFALLECLATRPGAVVTRAELERHLYEDGADPDSNAVDVFISRLRRKLAPDGVGDPIQTRRGQGYLLRPARVTA